MRPRCSPRRPRRNRLEPAGPWPAQSVGAYLDGLVHARKPEIAALRAVILSARSDIAERIKWNAPSFGPGAEDRVTFRLHPGERLELIFHRGATKHADADGFRFADRTGLIRWLAPDRGMIGFATPADTEAALPALTGLVRDWIEATAERAAGARGGATDHG